MSILPIRVTREPALHRTVAPINSFDSELCDLATDMIRTMHATPGVDLAAPQVSVDPRVFVWKYDGAGSFDTQYHDVPQLDEDSTRGPNTVLHGIVVNPMLDLAWDTEGAGITLPEKPSIAPEPEGCLSIPGYEYLSRRTLDVILCGCDVDGNAIEARAHGWLACVFQREHGHL